MYIVHLQRCARGEIFDWNYSKLYRYTYAARGGALFRGWILWNSFFARNNQMWSTILFFFCRCALRHENDQIKCDKICQLTFIDVRYAVALNVFYSWKKKNIELFKFWRACRYLAYGYVYDSIWAYYIIWQLRKR